MPVVLRLVKEAASAVLPAAAAAYGEHDPRFYVKVGGRQAQQAKGRHEEHIGRGMQ